ncbi:MAG: LysR family transcriptional regulator [Lachnospiraceae bacterium]|nr:LysR family transcriptional regulator [Lachnospiraceae bacterium]
MINELQIDYFLAVADNSSFTKTAEKLYVTQSAISKQISAMEKELDVVLFDRTNKYVTLTDAGKVFYDFYKEYRVKLAKVIDQARRTKESRYGFVKLGLVTGFAMPEELIARLRKFSIEFPNVKVAIECMGVHEQQYALNNDKLDVIMTLDTLIAEDKSLLIMPLTVIKRIAFFSKSHALAEKEDLSITDFANETFYTFKDQEKNLRSVLQEVFKNSDKVPEVVSFDSLYTAVASAECGMGVVVTNEWNTLTNTENLKGIPLGVESNIVLAMKNDSLNKEARVLANELSNMFENKE